ncbi:MAG TPA: PKD domain-containing protein [Thermoleophilaceae bacterium]|nr:PKD domain-containing protein [Thermoleophilaceae bacterium]
MRRSAILAAAVFALAAGPASAAEIGGKAWPGRGVTTITYFNASEAKWHVREGARAWNQSGVNVRFKPAPRNRADVLITNLAGGRSDNVMIGFATLGYVPPQGIAIVYHPQKGPLRSNDRNRMWLSKLSHPDRPNYNMAGVAAHEFGHILGLDHENDNCATMNSTLWWECDNARPCRLLERDDIEGAIRLYGGRARTRTPGFCPKPPKKVKRTGDLRKYEVTLEWRNQRGGLFDGVTVTRAKGKCPKRPPRFGGGLRVRNNRPGGRASLRDSLAPNRTGRYCYAFWADGGHGLQSRRKTVKVNYDPPRPKAPTNFEATVNQNGKVSLSWDVPDHPEFRRVEGGAKLDNCPGGRVSAEDGFFDGKLDATTAVFAPGRYCFAAWAVDTAGDRFGPVTTFVEFAGRPPVAEFEAYSYDLDVEFYDLSHDEDANGEIEHWVWNFGDGKGKSSEPNPIYTYGSAGTYTVTLLVIDDTGQTASTTQQVTVP